MVNSCNALFYFSGLRKRSCTQNDRHGVWNENFGTSSNFSQPRYPQLRQGGQPQHDVQVQFEDGHLQDRFFQHSFLKDSS